MNASDPLLSSGTLSDAIKNLGVHSHLCLIYETEAERWAAVVPFLRAGLERGERCIYIADQNNASVLVQQLRADGLDVEAYQRAGALVMMDKRSAYLRNGRFDPDQMIELLKQQVQIAKTAGFKVLRASGEMTWALGSEPGVERLLEYEAKLNDFFPQHDCVGLCQYDRRRFPPEILKGVIETHPLIITGGWVAENRFYIPPEEYHRRVSVAEQVDRMLARIHSRAETEHALRKQVERQQQTERLLAARTTELEKANEQLRESYRAALNLIEDATVARKKAEVALQLLRESEQRFRSFVEATAEAVIFHEQGQILDVNPAALSLFGYGSLLEVKGRNVLEFVAPQSRDLVREKIRTGDPGPYEAVALRKDQGPFVVEVLARQYPYQGRMVRVASLHDITERKRAEQALRESEERYRHVFESSLVGIYRTTPDGRVLLANPAFVRMLGYRSFEELARKNVDAPDFHPEYLRQRFKELMEREGQVNNFESSWILPDGTVIVALESAVAVRDEQGNILYYDGVVEDITERKRAEQALKEAAQQWQDTFDAVSEAVMILDTQQQMLRYNRAAKKLLGINGEAPTQGASSVGKSVIGHPCYQLVHNTHEPPSDCPLLRARRSGRRESGEMCVGSRWWQVTVDPILDADGQIAAFVHTAADVTERRRVEEKLREMNKMNALGEMASGIAHDINNNLACVLGFSELFLTHPEKLDDKTKTLHALRLINMAAHDAAEVLRRLREFYRKRESGAHFQVVDLKRLVGEAVVLTEPRWKTEARAKGISIEVRTDLRTVPRIMADPAEIREALTNLIFNAVDALPNGGVILLRAYSEGNEVVLEVSDNGVGMTEEVRQRCLEPFYTTKGEKGTGLGLSMVYGLVRRYNGTLNIQSAPAEGTTVTLRIPTVAVAAPETAETPVRVARPHLNVLLVEDDPILQEAMVAHLVEDSHFVVTARDGEEGLEKFRSGRYDVVITDRVMPRMDGLKLAQEIKKLSPTTPVILVSGYGSDPVPSEAPCVDYTLSKPVALGALREALVRTTGH